jgi:hypothetical protein
MTRFFLSTDQILAKPSRIPVGSLCLLMRPESAQRQLNPRIHPLAAARYDLARLVSIDGVEILDAAFPRLACRRFIKDAISPDKPSDKVDKGLLLVRGEIGQFRL